MEVPTERSFTGDRSVEDAGAGATSGAQVLTKSTSKAQKVAVPPRGETMGMEDLAKSTSPRPRPSLWTTLPLLESSEPRAKTATVRHTHRLPRPNEADRATDSPSLSASDAAYLFTRSQILEGAFAPGELLTEGAVAAAIGHSRTPVREAFLRLEREGYVALHKKRGATVVPVNSLEITQLFEAERVVELSALEVVAASDARYLEPSASGVFAGLLAGQRRAMLTGDVALFIESELAFHRSVVTIGGNSLLIGFHHELHARLERIVALSHWLPTRVWMRRSITEHEEIVRGLESARHKRARRALEEHLVQLRKVLGGGTARGRDRAQA
jgi:DNA-binding GntR family transcriptional regulator